MGCATPEPGESIEAMLERMQGDGAISTGDADAVAEFAEFLRDMGPAGSDADRGRQRRALIKHAEFCGLSASDVATLRAAEDLER